MSQNTDSKHNVKLCYILDQWLQATGHDKHFAITPNSRKASTSTLPSDKVIVLLPVIPQKGETANLVLERPDLLSEEMDKVVALLKKAGIKAHIDRSSDDEQRKTPRIIIYIEQAELEEHMQALFEKIRKKFLKHERGRIHEKTEKAIAIVAKAISSGKEAGLFIEAAENALVGLAHLRGVERQQQERTMVLNEQQQQQLGVSKTDATINSRLSVALGVGSSFAQTVMAGIPRDADGNILSEDLAQEQVEAARAALRELGRSHGIITSDALSSEQKSRWQHYLKNRRNFGGSSWSLAAGASGNSLLALPDRKDTHS